MIFCYEGIRVQEGVRVPVYTQNFCGNFNVSSPCGLSIVVKIITVSEDVAVLET